MFNVQSFKYWTIIQAFPELQSDVFGRNRIYNADITNLYIVMVQALLELLDDSFGRNQISISD